jgi:acetate kinase
LAVLHNPINLAGIRAVSDLMPGIPQVAVFDTSFFTSIPSHVFIYAVPYAWYEKYRIRRYGFHGTSHRFVARRAAALLGKPEYAVNVITLHIGNGVSITAVKGGVAYDHGQSFCDSDQRGINDCRRHLRAGGGPRIKGNVLTNMFGKECRIWRVLQVMAPLFPGSG